MSFLADQDSLVFRGRDDGGRQPAGRKAGGGARIVVGALVSSWAGCSAAGASPGAEVVLTLPCRALQEEGVVRL
ncbi:hypothetical protein DDF62_16140 [Caulobacter radicis]|uniref:Uncharacterized protein n=1 Tax=Caulobacter radicis TaxID=2172650 RepID=A0A2T9JVA8_9CAUL|nr:hypothetical protein [Caulobacter radicis]PVM84816.1 hypothetical protein DDF65_08225 [Caulobacter radicis]PVM87652.1 hypothetical protein DDF62_16140 [Caulobacter radicis]